jgi:phosphonate transport system substrate-binding protein
VPTHIEPDRREFLKAAVGGLAVLSFPRHSTAEVRPFQFGLTPVFLSNDLELLGHLQAFLTARLESPVELVTRRTYQEITALLVSGEIHAAWICGYPYVQHKADLDLVATPVWHGKPLYQSYIIAAADRKVDDWHGLAGDVHAFSDPDSNSGFLVTRALLAEKKILPEGFFKRAFFTYGHRNVIRAVASGLAQSGSVDGYVYEVMRETEPDLVKLTKIVRKSEWLGFPPIASPKSLAGDVRVKALQQALVSANKDPERAKVLSLLRLDGFVAADPSLFDTIAAKVETVRQLG